VELVALAFRLGILDGSERRAAVDAKGARVQLDAVLFPRPGVELRAACLYFSTILRWNGWPIFGAQFERMPLQVYLMGAF
jgi:hypothetical protein